MATNMTNCIHIIPPAVHFYVAYTTTDPVMVWRILLKHSSHLTLIVVVPGKTVCVAFDSVYHCELDMSVCTAFHCFFARSVLATFNECNMNDSQD